MTPRRHGVASPLCSRLLDALTTAFDAGDEWALMGGTGLAEYYLGHRQSDDVDLFSLDASSLERMADRLMATLPARLPGVTVGLQRVSPHCQRLHVRSADAVTSKIELLEDTPPWFGKPVVVDGIPVGSLTDIMVGKLSAFITRDEPRDLVDLWAVEHLGGLPVETLYPALFEKDPGIAAYPLAIGEAWQRHASQAYLASAVVAADVPDDLGSFCREQEERLLAFLRGLPGPTGPAT